MKPDRISDLSKSRYLMQWTYYSMILYIYTNVFSRFPDFLFIISLKIFLHFTFKVNTKGRYVSRETYRPYIFV